jgi:hypothetical protein
MTDYDLFIVREVSKLDRNADAGRRAVYARVREELLTKLHRSSLRIPEPDIASELRTFDAAVRRIEAEIADGQTLDPGIPALLTSHTSTDQTGSTPITGMEASSEATQTEAEAAEISCITEAKSAPPVGTTSADSDLQWQMLNAIKTALDFTVHPTDFDRKADLLPRTRLGIAAARTMRAQLTNMTLAIILCCVVFALIYVEKWLRF